MINVFDREIQFIHVAGRRPAGLRAAGGEGPVQRNLVLVEEGQHPIIEQVRDCDWCLPALECSDPHLL